MSEYQPPDGGGSVGLIDRAETFSESAVSLSLNQTERASESLGLMSEATSTATTDSDTTSRSESKELGIKFTPSENADSVTVRISESTSGVDEVRLRDSGNNLITTVSGAVSSGGTVTINQSLVAGQSYYVGVFNSAGYTMGLNDTGTFPHSGSFHTLNSGYYILSGSLYDTSDRAGIDQVALTRNATTTGTAYVEWPDPPDLYAWDRALYQVSEGTGSVDVYVEENDGTGWDEIAGPISRGYTINADPASEVRYRVELSRPDTSTQPSLDAIYRRYVV